jgi:hydroxyacylglutathione hydrolase
MTSWHYTAPAHPLVHTIPAFSDNYLWLVQSPDSNRAAVVDPGDAEPILRALESRGLSLVCILLTHHHADHAGGVAELVARTGARVVGPATPKIPTVTEPVAHGARVDPGLGSAPARVIAVPGHTLDHIAYLFPSLGSDPRPLLFCGDTLFAAGCGRVFEGTPGEMLASLDTLAALAPATMVFCAHEYTLSNLRFAAAAEPKSVEVAKRLGEASQMREAGLATVPSSIAIERETNPFLRVDQPALAEQAALRLGRASASRVETFATIRQWKNEFR